MKRIITLTLILVLSLTGFAKGEKKINYSFTEATELTIVGKMFPDTPNPYERLDYEKYGGFTEKDIRLVRMSSGIAVAFNTNSTAIGVKAEYNLMDKSSKSAAATRGFDLYIKKDGKWLWAGDCVPPESGKSASLVVEMDGSMKECLMYFPLYSQMKSVKIGVVEGSSITPGAQPFRHKVAIFGSSFTHGSSTTRAGLTYPAIFTRKTGIQILSMGVSGDCTMQPQFANAFKYADVDAFIFDSFSNGSDKTIERNLFNFIETLQAAHPGKPLIFQRTIYRERRNFNKVVDEAEARKAAKAEELMAQALKKYKDVYFITPDATSDDHETTMDGTHPGDYGYYLWAESIVKPVTKILKKYGIR